MAKVTILRHLGTDRDSSYTTKSVGNYSGSFTPDAGATTMDIMMIGGGGAGEGCLTSSSNNYRQSSAGGCGGFMWIRDIDISTALADNNISSDGVTIPYTIGHGGWAATSDATSSTVGGDTSIGVSGGLAICGGGDKGSKNTSNIAATNPPVTAIPAVFSGNGGTNVDNATSKGFNVYYNVSELKSTDSYSFSFDTNLNVSPSSATNVRYAVIVTGRGGFISWLGCSGMLRNSISVDTTILTRTPGFGWGYGGTGNYHIRNTHSTTYSSGENGGVGVIIISTY